MNALSKLKEMGFRKTNFHKPDFDYRTGIEKMILDDRKIANIDGKAISQKIIRPKSDSFFLLDFSLNITIWVSVKSHTISTIWIEAKNKVVKIYDEYSEKSLKINGRRDIINLFPIEMRRDFLLKDIFR